MTAFTDAELEEIAEAFWAWNPPGDLRPMNVWRERMRRALEGRAVPVSSAVKPDGQTERTSGIEYGHEPGHGRAGTPATAPVSSSGGEWPDAAAVERALDIWWACEWRQDACADNWRKDMRAALKAAQPPAERATTDPDEIARLIWLSLWGGFAIGPEFVRKRTKRADQWQLCKKISEAIKAKLSTPPSPPDPETECEIAVGRWVYRRIEVLMNSLAGTPEGSELSYLAALVADVEEYGATGEHPVAAAPNSETAKVLEDSLLTLLGFVGQFSLEQFADAYFTLGPPGSELITRAAFVSSLDQCLSKGWAAIATAKRLQPQEQSR